MCIAIGQSTGSRTLTDNELTNGWKSNPDGGGFAYIDSSDSIVTFKSMDKDTFIEAYHRAHQVYGSTSPFIVHMRIATHGSIKIETVHPFPIETDNGQTVLAHNGIIGSMEKLTSKDVSDTMAFCDEVVSRLPDNWLDSDTMVDMVAEYIGFSKLVVLTTSPDCEATLYIINPQMGFWEDDIWFSNTSCVGKVYDWVRDETAIGGWVPLNSKSGTGEWIDSLDVLYDATVLSTATASELYAITEEVQKSNAACLICTGVSECYCAELCVDCYEQYHECACKGDFESLLDRYGAHWELINSDDDKKESEPAKVLASGGSSHDEKWPWGDDDDVF